MIDSKIQWTDHTWNIAVGCTKIDDDCRFCYMYRGSLEGTRYDPKRSIGQRQTSMRYQKKTVLFKIKEIKQKQQ